MRIGRVIFTRICFWQWTDGTLRRKAREIGHFWNRFNIRTESGHLLLLSNKIHYILLRIARNVWIGSMERCCRRRCEEAKLNHNNWQSAESTVRRSNNFALNVRAYARARERSHAAKLFVGIEIEIFGKWAVEKRTRRKHSTLYVSI